MFLSDFLLSLPEIYILGAILISLVGGMYMKEKYKEEEFIPSLGLGFLITTMLVILRRFLDNDK